MTQLIMLPSVIGIAAIVVFIMAIRTSYAIEKRSDGTITWGGAPRYTNMFRTVSGHNVAQDDETLALVKRLRMLLAIVLVLMLAMGLVASVDFSPTDCCADDGSAPGG